MTTPRRPLLLSLALASVALLPTGCATVLCFAFQDRLSPYAGTAFDVGFASESSPDPSLRALAALDAPFSFLADTLLLPVSLPVSLAHRAHR